VWARGSAAEDLAVLLEEKNDEDGAVSWLTRALKAYSRSGALRDQARVRARLRKLGVRPRHWAPRQRSVSGWDSLTETERTASELVALGLSNQEVADRMYVSVHTVAFHLRHVFRKLNTRSRAELTRLVIERRNGVAGGLMLTCQHGTTRIERPGAATRRLISPGSAVTIRSPVLAMATTVASTASPVRARPDSTPAS
jgi:DNA-binding CsgD family transcriptional regulator